MRVAGPFFKILGVVSKLEERDSQDKPPQVPLPAVASVMAECAGFHCALGTLPASLRGGLSS